MAKCPSCGEDGTLVQQFHQSVVVGQNERHERECLVSIGNGFYQVWVHGKIVAYWVPGRWENWDDG